METIVREVRDLKAPDRQAIEHVIGRTLSEDQKVIFQVVPASVGPAAAGGQPTPAPGQLPEWCNVFDGLTDDEIEAVDKVIRQRAKLTRPMG